jgi:hypothetical protein
LPGRTASRRSASATVRSFRRSPITSASSVNPCTWRGTWSCGRQRRERQRGESRPRRYRNPSCLGIPKNFIGGMRPRQPDRKPVLNRRSAASQKPLFSPTHMTVA